MANDFRTFSIQLDDFARKVGLSGQTVQKRVAFDLYGRIVRKTPVDTGRARASWNISVNQADRSVTQEVRVRGGEQHSRSLRRSAVKRAITQAQTANVSQLIVQPGDTIIISNNLPYIVKLENGHSQQAPAGMVAVSIAEVDVAMSRLAAEGIREAGL